MDKSPEAFRTISEVAIHLDLPQHVLRFWETRFAQIKPLKRGGGRRYYRPDDVDLLRGIQHLLYGRGYTIKGVQRILKEDGVRSVQAIARGEMTAPDPENDAHEDPDASLPNGATATEAVDAPGVELRETRTAEGLLKQRDSEPDPTRPFNGRYRLPPPERNGLDPQDVRRLQSALAELAESARVLDRLRLSDEGGSSERPSRGAAEDQR